MSVFGKFENKVEGAVDGAAEALFASPIEPAQIAKKAEKQMKREKLVGSGRQYAPTLYNVLVNARDDKRLFGFYPTMASEIENYLYAKGTDAGLEFDTRPLVRFIPDPKLKKGRFDVIAEVVAAPIIKKLREEEMEYYGLKPKEAPAPAPAPAEERPVRAASPRSNDDSPQWENQRQGYPRGNSLPSLSAESKRFAGLDVPAVFDDILDSGEVTPFSIERPPIRSLPSLGDEPLGAGARAVGGAAGAAGGAGAAAGAGARAAGVGAGAGAAGGRVIAGAFGNRERAADSLPSLGDDSLGSLDSLSYEDDERVIGHASLYNLSDQESYRLDKRKLTAGRSKDNEIVLPDANASRVHVRFSQDATGKWKVTDLGSTNGTQLNGSLVSSAILRKGDEITIGTTILEFVE